VKLLLSFVLVASTLSFASHDHGIGKIVTDDLDLSYIDHVLTGRVGDRPVFAKPLKGEFGLQLWHQSHGQEFETVFKKNGASLSGDVQGVTLKKQPIGTQFVVTGVNGREGLIEGHLAGRNFKVRVTSDKVSGHHFVSPHFEVVFEDGERLEFDLEGGEACMGCAVRLSYAILSMLHIYEADSQ
jgi:hypothetical protein